MLLSSVNPGKPSISIRAMALFHGELLVITATENGEDSLICWHSECRNSVPRGPLQELRPNKSGCV